VADTDVHVSRFSTTKRLVTGIVVLAALAILVALGTWQVQRLHWKEGLLHDIADRTMAMPVTLAEISRIAATGGDIDYRTVSVSGVFDHSRERHFFATFNGETGYYVFTPLQLADMRYLFVNRGFVPYDLKEPARRPMGQILGIVAIHGLARPKLPQKPSSLVPDNDIPANIFYWKDLDAMAASTRLKPEQVVPFFVDADATANPGGLPAGGVTQFDLPNSHLQYAMTWYGLALALVAVVVASFFRRRLPETPKP